MSSWKLYSFKKYLSCSKTLKSPNEVANNLAPNEGLEYSHKNVAQIDQSNNV